MTEFDYVAERARFERWKTEVRDPATAAALDPVVYRAGRSTAKYRIAPVPAGWTWQHAISYADGSGGSVPWDDPVPTQAEAVEAAKRHLLSWLHARDDRPGSAELRALINPDQEGLF